MLPKEVVMVMTEEELRAVIRGIESMRKPFVGMLVVLQRMCWGEQRTALAARGPLERVLGRALLVLDGWVVFEKSRSSCFGPAINHPGVAWRERAARCGSEEKRFLRC